MLLQGRVFLSRRGVHDERGSYPSASASLAMPPAASLLVLPVRYLIIDSNGFIDPSITVRLTVRPNRCTADWWLSSVWSGILGCLGGEAVRRRTRGRKVAGSTPGRGAIKSTRSTQPSIPPGR